MPKTRRRGHIHKRGPNSWLVSLHLGNDASGKRKVHYKTIRGAKRDAEQYLNKIVREVDLGIFVDAPAMTLNEYFNKWFESVARLRSSERTAHGCESIFKRYFRDTLGYKKLEKLHVLDIQKIYSEMLGRGLSAVTVRHAHSVINCALKQAVKWNLLPRNPAELVELPKAQRKERRVLSAEEAQRFIATSDEIRHGLIFEFAADRDATGRVSCLKVG